MASYLLSGTLSIPIIHFKKWANIYQNFKWICARFNERSVYTYISTIWMIWVNFLFHSFFFDFPNCGHPTNKERLKYDLCFKVESARIPRTLECELTEDLVKACIPGDDVTLTGIIKVFHKFIICVCLH